MNIYSTADNMSSFEKKTQHSITQNREECFSALQRFLLDSNTYLLQVTQNKRKHWLIESKNVS